MRFTKMHGCGNDYVYVNAFDETVEQPSEVAVRVSDRHFGIGADGLILILPSDVADVRMQMFNADGSEAEMCGNGIRCLARYAFDHDLVDKTELDVETAAGVKRLALTLADDGTVAAVRVNMGEPRLDRAEIPMLGPPGRVVAEPLDVDGLQLDITAVSMGNPHCVIRVHRLDDYPVTELGPKIERLPEFPERTNVEFVEVCSETELRQRTWERGSGETLACGTGAAAVTVAGTLNGWSARRVTIHLVGGDLELEWAEDGCVYMAGPAIEVFSGEMRV
jgi:diaminopimelate epimerase